MNPQEMDGSGGEDKSQRQPAACNFCESGKAGANLPIQFIGKIDAPHGDIDKALSRLGVDHLADLGGGCDAGLQSEIGAGLEREPHR